MTIDRSIAAIAQQQHSLVTVAQVREIGADRRALDRRVRAGRLEQVGDHVFRIAGVPPSWESRVLGAVLDGGPAARATHLTAGALWGIGGLRRHGRPEMSVPRGRRHRPTTALCHESTDLDRCATVVIDGIPTTDLARTLLDLGRHFGIAKLTRVVEDARRLHGLTWSTLIQTLFAHARQGRHGIRRLRAVITANAARDDVTDSDFEMLVLALLAEHGLPAPTVHHEVWAGDVLIAELDLAWPGRRVAIEVQGRHHRENAEVYERDQIKLVELQRLGWTIIPVTWEIYVKRTRWLLGRLRDALAPR